MKDYVIKVQKGSTDEVKTKTYLKKFGVFYTEFAGVLGVCFIQFKAKKRFWKQIKKDLNLTTYSVHSMFR